MASTDSSRIASGLSSLSLKPNTATGNKGSKAGNPKKAAQVADSWEDDDATSGSDTESTPGRGRGAGEGNAGTQAPPPTPISPNYNTSGSRPFSPVTGAAPAYPPGFDDDDAAGSVKRPEKTDAVARRMIAGALGVRAPKQTDEQRAYEKAMREKERKRREEEKAAERRRQAESEKAKKAIWDD